MLLCTLTYVAVVLETRPDVLVHEGAELGFGRHGCPLGGQLSSGGGQNMVLIAYKFVLGGTGLFRRPLGRLRRP